MSLCVDFAIANHQIMRVECAVVIMIAVGRGGRGNTARNTAVWILVVDNSAATPYENEERICVSLQAEA